MATPQAASPLPLPLTAAFTVAANTLPTIWLANVFPVATPGSQLWPVIKRNIQRESTRSDTPNCTSVSPRGDESFSLSLVTIACKRSLRELEVEQLLALQGNPTYIPLVVFMCKVLFRERKATRRRDPRQRTALMGFRHPENLYSSSFFQSLNKLGKLVQTIKPGFRLVHGLFFFFFFWPRPGLSADLLSLSTPLLVSSCSLPLPRCVIHIHCLGSRVWITHCLGPAFTGCEPQLAAPPLDPLSPCPHPFMPCQAVLEHLSRP